MQLTCWCGNRALVPFGPSYAECQNCSTLVSSNQPDADLGRVRDDATDFYGREYWLSHASVDLHQGDIMQRSRSDLPERCVYWLRTTLKYMLPPARVLEAGSGPGAFVALLHWAGFDATGLELSPWVVDYAHQTFGIPMLTGPVEDQAIEPHSLDAIVMMDVLEHLVDPLGTLRCATRLLKPDGVLIVQMPRLPLGRSFEQLVAANDRFVEHLRPDEHLYLFSDRSVRQLLGQLGLTEVVSEQAIFAHYDMFVFASRTRLVTHDRAEIEAALLRQPSGRLMLGLLDLDDRVHEAERRLVESESDRAARLAAIDQLQTQLKESEADRAARLSAIEQVQRQLRESEADRAARLSSIEQLETQLQHSEADRAARLSAIETLQARLLECEADRAARLDAINALGSRLAAQDDELNQVRRELVEASSEPHANG